MWRQPRLGTKVRHIKRQSSTETARRIPSFSLLMADWSHLKIVCRTSRTGRPNPFPHPHYGIHRIYLTSSPRDALSRTRPIGDAAMARAIGQAVDRRVAAETEIVGAGRADRPAASGFAQFEQRAGVVIGNRLLAV